MDPEEVLDDLLGELKLRNYSVTTKWWSRSKKSGFQRRLN